MLFIFIKEENTSMKKTKIAAVLCALLAAAGMVFTSCASVKVTAADCAPSAALMGTVTDAGQVVSCIRIDFGKDFRVEGITADTFTVHAKASNPDYIPADQMSFGIGEADRAVVKVETRDQAVYLWLDQSTGATLSYLYPAARNIPVVLDYTVTQNTPVTLTDKKGNVLDAAYVSEVAVSSAIVEDSETVHFESVTGSEGINYQFCDAGKADTLIVWFHGNGEGDFASSGNNVAQMLANRGTVAWATEEAQEIFGGAHVMAFQAPDTWYYAQKDGLLDAAYAEIQAVAQSKGVKKIYVSGCSAGGYMTTRMIIKYPDLFDAAMINCPALDVADGRGGETPTDDELETIRASRTAIWLVQADDDTTVRTADCSVRLFNILTEGEPLLTSSVEQDLVSDFTTEETSDGKYKLTLYKTVMGADGTSKIVVPEDYDLDGIYTATEYSNHWSWIYTLRNNPKDAEGNSIWSWAASK